MTAGPAKSPDELQQNMAETTTMVQTAGSLLLFGTAGLLLLWLLFADSLLSLPLKLIWLSILFLTLHRWTGVLLLVPVQLDLLLREPRRSGPGDSGAALVFIAAVLLLLLFCSRYHLLKPLTRGQLAGWGRRLLMPDSPSASASARTGGADVSVMVEAAWRLIVFVVQRIVVVTACVLAARALLQQMPARRDLTAWLLPATDGSPEIWPGSLFLVLVLAVCLVVSELAWRQMTRSQARLYLRSVFVSEHYTDLRMIVQRRLQASRRRNQTAGTAREAEAESVP